MADFNGRFVWYDLMTTDVAAARAFYSKVVEWRADDQPMPGMDYWSFNVGDQPAAGLMPMPEEVR